MTLMAHVDTEKLDRVQLAELETPASTATHQVIPHVTVVNELVETLGFRHISVVRDEYAVSKDGNKMFGVLDLEHQEADFRFSLGLRNAHDKSMRLALTVGLRVFVCDNMAFSGDFTPVLAKHTKHFNLQNALTLGVDQAQRGFKPLAAQVQTWKDQQLDPRRARLIIYRAFTEGELEAPRHLDRLVHEAYFNPPHEAFAPRTMWSLQNAFTEAFKQLEPVPQFRSTASLGEFFKALS